VLGKEMLIYCPAGDIIPIITDPGIGNSPGRKTSSIGWTSRDRRTYSRARRLRVYTCGGRGSPEGIFFEIRERAE